MRMPSRSSRITYQEVGGEVIAYDPTNGQVHRLNATCATVFLGCDGKASRAGVAERLGPGGEDLLGMALERLRSHDLVEGGSDPKPGLSRRGFVSRYGKAMVVALPFVTSLAIPRPAFALSAGCVDCAGNAFGCVGCSTLVCERCANPGSCATTACGNLKRRNGATCAADTTANKFCINYNASPPCVNMDCATARANAADPCIATLSDGSTLNSGAFGPSYFCCGNCT